VLISFFFKVNKIGAFSSEKQLAANIQSFFEDPNLQLFVLQCNTITDTPHVLLAKSLIDQSRAEYLKNLPSTSPTSPHKHVLILLHLQRGLVSSENDRWQFNFQCGWGQITIDTIEEPANGIPLSSLLDGLVQELLTKSDTFSLKKCIQESVNWALLCIKYPPSKESVNRINK
jgi:hypothetical protein